MNGVLAFAIFIVLWWVVLFTVLPYGLKTQDEDADVTLGTVPSAPRNIRHVVMAMVWTTVISVVVFAAFLAVTTYFDVGLDDIPKIVPEFD